jgi:hypothetical protein
MAVLPHTDGVTPAAAMRNYMAQEGARLIDSGYPAIPIAAAAKFPGEFKPSQGWKAMPGWRRWPCTRSRSSLTAPSS